MTMSAGPRRRPTWQRAAGRGAVLAGSTLTLLMGMAGSASAAGSGGPPPALNFIRAVDSRGISLWQYEMSLDRGGVTDPGKFFWSLLIDLGWEAYRASLAVVIWLTDWILGFSWLATISTPVLALSDSLTGIVARFGLTAVLTTAAAVVAVSWMARGRWALGLFELFTSLIVASLAVGALASPVQSIAGQDGLLMQSRDLGLSVANGLASNGQQVDADPARMQANTTALLTDTFIRVPAQLMNFGAVIDGGPCEGAYDKVLKDGPYGTDSNIRDAVKDCDEDLGTYAENPSVGQVMSLVVLAPATLLILIFAMLLGGSVLLAAVYALYQGLKAIVTLVTGLLPGAARGALWATAADLIIALVTLVFSVVFLAGYLLIIQDTFAASSGGTNNIMATFFFVDALLIVGMVAFWRGRKSLQRAAGKLAQVLASRPSTAATALPQKRPFDPTALYYKGKLAAGAYNTLTGRGRRSPTDSAGGERDTPAGPPVAPSAAPRGPGRGGAGGTGPTRPAQGPPPGGGGGTGGGSAGAGSAGVAGRVTRRVLAARAVSRTGQLVRFGATVAAAASSAGTSTVLTQALPKVAGKPLKGRVINTARRQLVRGQLERSQLALPTGPAQPPAAAKGDRAPVAALAGTPVAGGTAAGSRLPRGRVQIVSPTDGPREVAGGARPSGGPAGQADVARLRAALLARRRLALPAAPPAVPGR